MIERLRTIAKVIQAAKLAAAFALAVSAAAVLPSSVSAASSATIVIDVTVNANLSVSIDGSGSSTHTVLVTPGAGPVVSPATATVTNDSVGMTEKWKLSTDDAYDTVLGGAGWELVTSTSGAGAPDIDQFALQALFISSKAAAGDCSAALPASAWDQAYAAPLTSTPQTYSSTLYSDLTDIGGSVGLPDKTAGGSDGNMKRGSSRGLCWRIVPPASVNSVHDQIITIVVTASPGQ